MKGLLAALWTESLKVRKSKMLLATIIAFSFIAIMMGLLVLASKHPEIAGKSATISAKASAIGKADWPSYFDLLIQIILALGTLAFGIVSSWVFGREYSDRVIKDLLALPVSRSTIVLSKFIIVMIWSILLSLTLFAFGFLTGLAVNLADWSNKTFYHALVTFAGSSIFTILLCTPVAFVASFSRGYILPIAFAISTLIMTQFISIGAPSVMPYFPWAIPALYSGVAGAELPQPGVVSYIILGFTSISGLFGTAAWWRFADQT